MKLGRLIKSRNILIWDCIFNLQMFGENSEPTILRSFSKIDSESSWSAEYTIFFLPVSWQSFFFSQLENCQSVQPHFLKEKSIFLKKSFFHCCWDACMLLFRLLLKHFNCFWSVGFLFWWVILKVTFHTVSSKQCC